MNRSIKAILLISIAVLACFGLIFVEVQTNIVRHTSDDLIYDNRNHYLPCDQLPTEPEVRAIVEQHQATIRAIEQINPGFVGVDVDTTTCPGKSDLVIWYGGHQDRLAIEAIIGDDTFFSIPYRLQNR